MGPRGRPPLGVGRGEELPRAHGWVPSRERNRSVVDEVLTGCERKWGARRPTQHYVMEYCLEMQPICTSHGRSLVDLIALKPQNH
eukprot:scaffold798_cov367-Pavlova_lutheri.AAC.28